MKKWIPNTGAELDQECFAKNYCGIRSTLLLYVSSRGEKVNVLVKIRQYKQSSVSEDSGKRVFFLFVKHTTILKYMY